MFWKYKVCISFVLSCLLLAAIAAYPSEVCAWTVGNEFNFTAANEFIPAGDKPSLGTLLAAALETAGYGLQSGIIRDLKEILSGLAALIYLGVLISALITLALAGHYRAIIWVLIGPVLFSFTVTNTINATGAQWQFGVFKDSKLENNLKSVLSRNQLDKEFEVSRLFHLYNVIISSSFQYIIGVITNKQMLPQMKFMARQRVMDDLYGIELDNANLKSLVQFFYGHCHQEIAYATMIALGNREKQRIARTNANYLGFSASPEYDSASKYYCANFPLRNKPFPPGPWQDYVVRTLQESPNPEMSLVQYRIGQVTHTTVSCAQLWRWSVLGARRHVGEHLKNMRITDVEPYGEKVYGEDFWRHLIKDVAAKVTQEGRVQDLDPCPYVAERFNSQLNSTELHRYFAGMLIRDQLNQDPRSMMFEQFIQHGQVSIERTSSWGAASDPGKKEKIIRRLRAQELAESQKYEAFWMLMAMPYLQGIILFALAGTFPFFALMLILPGQSGCFFSWMALWAWAKSWDIGWALIMVIDNVLWELLPKVSYYDFPGGQNLDSSEFDTPVNLLDAIFSGDHSYSLSAYWLLLSLMIGAVPVLSAQAVLGSKKAMAGILIDGLRTMGSRLGSTAGDWLSHEQIERNDVRAVRSAVRNVNSHTDMWWQKMQARFKDYKEKYGANLFTRTVGRPLVVAGKTLEITGLNWLTSLDQATENAGIFKNAGSGIANFGIDFASAWEEHIGVPAYNFMTKVHNNVAKPVVKWGGRATIHSINATSQTVRDFQNLWIGLRRTLGSDTDYYPAYTQDIPVEIVDKVVEFAMPELSEHVPRHWKNVTLKDLERLQREAEEDTAEAVRLTVQGWKGILEQIGAFEFEIKRSLAKLKVDAEDFGLLQQRRIEQRDQEVGIGGFGKHYFQQVSEDEIERRCLFGLYRSMADSVGGLNATSEIDRAQIEVERLRMKAYLYGTGAEVLTYGGVAASYFGQVPIGLGLFHTAYQINSNSVDMHRIVNSYTAQLMELNAQVWMYNAFQRSDWYFAQEIRAGISLRGEWWNVPEIPYSVPGDADRLSARLRAEASNLSGALVGDIAWTSVLLFSKGSAAVALTD